MGFIWTATKEVRKIILQIVEENGRVTALQVERLLRQLGYSVVARYHLDRLASEGQLKRIGGPTYYEVKDGIQENELKRI